MENYKEMYFKLFNKLTDFSRQIEEIQRETEEMFLCGGEDSRPKVIKKQGSQENWKPCFASFCQSPADLPGKY